MDSFKKGHAVFFVCFFLGLIRLDVSMIWDLMRHLSGDIMESLGIWCGFVIGIVGHRHKYQYSLENDRMLWVFVVYPFFFGPRPTRGFSFCLDLSTYGGDLTTNHGIELIKATILYLGDLTKRTWWDMICEVADFTNILFLTSVLSRQQRVDKDLSTPTKVRQGFIRPWSEMVPECPWMFFILMLASFSFIFPLLQFVGLKPTRGYQ